MMKSTSPSTSNGSVAETTTHWHTLTSEEILQSLETDAEKGLTRQTIEARQKEFGANELEESGGRSTFQILWDQFTNIMLVMLIAVALVSGFLDLRKGEFPKDAIAIFAIVILNGILGYLQESRAEKALAALKKLSSPKVRVVRDGNISEVAAKELVPGDLMLLEAGVQIASDGFLLEEQNLKVREAALTGEAEGVEKRAGIQLPEDAPLGDRLNVVYQGTEVINGRAKVVVTNTGMKTELGKIASLLQSVESEPTPLQQRMTQLGNVLVSGSLILVAIVVLGGVIASGWDKFEQLLEVSLSMAVAVVPEGLPAVVTVTLAIGTQRMVRRNALIRKLPAVETLGSVTTICSDKTGTLTQNKMVVQRINTLTEEFQVSGSGYVPMGEILGNGVRISHDNLDNLQNYADVNKLVAACVVCNDAVLQNDVSQGTNEWIILGDPTEGALLSLAGKAGMFRETWEKTFPRVGEFPFSSDRKRMSVINRDLEGRFQSDYIMFTKGSPELILERCTHVQLKNSIVLLTPQQRETILEQNNQMASKGLRVLGFSCKNTSEVPQEESQEKDLVWLGLVGMLDAPRLEVRDAVAKCKQAGIGAVMITGDHQLTAKAIAQDLGLAKEGDEVVTGQQLQKMSDQELEGIVKRVRVYARVSPEHKLRIVKALQKQHEFVAMTGDGVNDAPALKQADIGIAMGITGTDVSKEASDMILLDDNFATIVAATEEGRVVYTNIRRFIKYILGSNIGEVLTVAAAPLLGLGGVPLSPLQILWMNLVTDGLPALALAMEPGEPNVMERPPFDPRESIFARGLGSYMVRIGIVFAIITIALMVWAYGYTQSDYGRTLGDPDRWKTMVFTTLCLAQMGHALAIRSNTQLTIQLNPFSNPYVLGSVVLTTMLQLMLIYVEPLAKFFGTHPLTGFELLICVGFSALMFVWIEGEKVFINYVLKKKMD